MRRPRVPKVKTQLHAIISNLPSSGLATSGIVGILIRDHSDVIKQELDDIVEIGLTKIAGDVARWRSDATPSTQLKLFDEYHVAEILSLRVEGMSQKINKSISDITVTEGKSFVQQHERRRALSPKVEELDRLVKYVEGAGIAPTENLVKGWIAAKAAGK